MGLSNLMNFSKNVKKVIIMNFVITTVVYGIYNTYIGIYIKELGFKEGEVGQILSSLRMSVAIGSFFCIYFYKKMGIKKIIFLGYFLLSFGIIGTSFIKNISLLKILAGVIGIGYSFPGTSVSVLLMELTTFENRVEIFSSSFVIQSLGLMIGNYGAGKGIKYFSKLVDVKLGIPIVFLISVVFILINLYFLRDLRVEKKEEIERKKVDFFKNIKKLMNKKVKQFLIYTIVIGLGAGMVIPFFSVYLKYALNIDNEKVGLIMGISQIGLIIGGAIVPYLSRYLGRVKTVAVCQVLSIPFLISIAFPQGLFIVGVSFLLRSTLMNLNQPLIQNIALEIVSSDERMEMNGMVSIISNGANSIGMIIAGYIMEHISYNFPYYITIVLYLTATTIFYNSFKDMDKRKE